jgi:hypothetical protein
MPFFKAKSKSKKDTQKAVSKNLRSLKNGPHHKDRTHKQEIAIALKKARGDDDAKKTGKKTPKKQAKKAPRTTARRSRKT